ncbi:hypothetical protein HMN09_00771600 [Mycena chlorophos]|uniref:Uncharacterized protein n=1 Tax=Mycena chlorophos TaxID=658473 RepID=A0A8H6SUK2_MYCCL|nr:hypothetical protein HMN09_00771600 [Mycena chlorophos]
MATTSSSFWRRAIHACEPYAHLRDQPDDFVEFDYWDLQPAVIQLPDVAYPEQQYSFVRAEPIPARTPKPSPQASCSGRTINDVEVQTLFRFLDARHHRGQHLIRPRCSDVAFALAALRVYRFPSDTSFAFFWSAENRVQTAWLVQRVLDSGERVVIPVVWEGASAALATLAKREQPILQQQPLKRKAPPPSAEPPHKTRRVTRQTARSEAIAEAAAAELAGKAPRPPGRDTRAGSEDSSKTAVASTREMSAETAVGEQQEKDKTTMRPRRARVGRRR